MTKETKYNELRGCIARATVRVIAYIVLVCRFEGKRPKRRREDDIETDPEEIICDGVESIHLAQDGNQWWGLVNVVKKNCGL